MAIAVWINRAALADIWMMGTMIEDQSHILLAPFVGAWLFWLRRSRLRSVPLAPSLWGPLLVILGWTMAWLGFTTGRQVLWHSGALVGLLGCVVSVFGLRLLLHFKPAFAAILFLIPIPGAVRQMVAIPLQATATNVTQALLELIGEPATRLGNVLVINGQEVAIAEACNGLRMVFALGLIVYAFAFSVPLRPSVRLMMLAISPLAALISNVIRLVPTTFFFGYGTAGQAERFHDLAGWVMLPIALAMLIGVLRMIRWIDIPVMSFRLAMK